MAGRKFPKNPPEYRDEMFDAELDISSLGKKAPELAQGEGMEEPEEDLTPSQAVPMAKIPPSVQELIDSGELTLDILEQAKKQLASKEGGGEGEAIEIEIDEEMPA